MKAGLKLTLTATLLAGASLAALSAQAREAEVIFGAEGVGSRTIEAGRAVHVSRGVTQIRLDNGAVASFVGDAEFALREDGALDLRSGTVTVSSPAQGEVVVRMPGGLDGRLGGTGASASFTATAADASGHVMSGEVTVTAKGSQRRFTSGQFWRARGFGTPDRIADAGNPVPAPLLPAGRVPAVSSDLRTPDLTSGGPVAVAESGLPVALGEALAANGASGDVVAAARRVEASATNPAIDTIPTADYGTLTAYAAQLAHPNGGTAFPGAGADIVRTYFQYLAGGGAREQFLQTYAALLVQYLDLIRSGAAPSSFHGASVQQINDFLAWQARTSGFGALSAENRALVEAYRAFLAGNGDPDRFARTYTDLVAAYFAWLRAGGAPEAFSGASQATIDAYLAFLRDAGLTGQLTAQNRALLDAYLAGLADGGTGFAFAGEYRDALGGFFDYLRAGNLPEAYSGASAGQLRAWLETLDATGLFDTTLGSEASFFRGWLAHLRAGGDPDGWAGLPANIFAGYANALSGLDAYLASGQLPSAYAALSADTLRAWLEALDAAGALDRYLGASAGFYAAWLADLRAGHPVDAFAGLPANVFAGYAGALGTYYDYLRNGGVPSNYTGLSQDQIAAWLAALHDAGALDHFLGELADFYSGYRDYLASGGNPDLYSGLPTPPDFPAFTAAVTAYAAFLRAGGLPSAYGDLDPATLRQYLDALSRAGLLDDGLLRDYLAWLTGGGAPDRFAGLPVYTGYASALADYYDYLAGGGLPSGYGALTAAQIQAYLAALSDAGILDDLLGAQQTFLAAYLDYLRDGGVPDRFAGLPVFDTYAATLQAYFAYIADGGLPSAYGAVDPARILAYLHALQDVGLLDALLANAPDGSAFAAYLLGGGTPDRFPGLPVLDTYGAAVRAYLAYIQNGGLPSAYGAANAAQILAWLSALQNAGILDDLLAGAPDGATYAAYLLGGGTPDRYAGLPVYRTWAAALEAFLAYIAGGGRPSAYTGATQEEIAGYIEGLEEAGVLETRYDDGDRAHLLDYAEHVDAGEDPDDFTGLPGAPVAPLPAPDYSYSGGFVPGATHSYKAITPTAAGLRSFNSQNNGVQMVADGEGRVTQLSNLIRTQGAQVKDVGGNSEVVVGRWTGGNYTVGNPVFTPEGAQSLHYYAAAPATLAVPGAGRIDYTILAATQPTYESGYGAEGVFDGALSIDFATRRAGLQGEIRMPGTDGAVSYAFSTTGGTANPGEQLFLDNPGDFTVSAAMTGDGRGCGGSCTLFFLGGFAGSSAENLGFVYHSLGVDVTDPILGAVAFHGEQTDDGNPIPAPVYSYAAGLPATALRTIVDYARLSDGRRQSETVDGTATLASGGANAIQGGTGFFRDTADQTDVWGDARVVVGRWTDGSFRTGSASGPVQTLSGQAGFHYALMTAPSFTVPYVGRVDYTLLAATRPTYVGGGTLPGVFDATMSIAFASDPKVGISGTILMPETSGVTTYDFATPGGSAAPAQTLTVQANGSFVFLAGLTGSGTACTGASCSITFNGSFGGVDPLRIGMTYGTQGPQGQAGPQIQGAAAFTGSWVGAPQSLTHVTDRPFFATTLMNEALNPSQGSYDVNGAGEVIGLTSFNGLFDRLGTATVVESGSLAANLVGWSRWSNGTLDIRRFGPSAVVLSQNAGYQIMHGAPLANMPASGTASYTIHGGTHPTDGFGTIAPGELASGTAKVAFGSTVKVGFDITAQFNGNSYNLFTTGRTADVSTSELTIGAGGAFNAIGPGGNVTSTGTDCAGTSCRPIWNGFLAGDGATGIALHYRVQNTVARNLDFHGVAAFSKDGATPAAAASWQGWATGASGKAVPGVDVPVPGAGMPAPAGGVAAGDLRDAANAALKGFIRF